MADIKDIRTILRDLHLVSGFRVSLHGTDFSEISAYPEEISPFCRLVQENPKAIPGRYTFTGAASGCAKPPARCTKTACFPGIS